MDGEMRGLRIAKAIAESEKILQRGNGIKQLLGTTWQVLQLCACKYYDDHIWKLVTQNLRR